MKMLLRGGLLLLTMCAFSWEACHNNESKQRTQPRNYSIVKPNSEAAQADTVCYLSTQGTTHTDSTKVSLYINKGDVSGRMTWIPYGKDSRRGTLAGSKQDSLISGVWVYMQEGKKDTIKVQFKVKGDQLYQKAFSVNAKTGKEESNANDPWSVVFNTVDCGGK